MRPLYLGFIAAAIVMPDAGSSLRHAAPGALPSCTYGKVGTTAKCKGLLPFARPARSDSSLFKKILLDIRSDFSYPHLRDGDCTPVSDCRLVNNVKSGVIRDARSLDLERLPAGKGVLVGLMEFPRGASYPDYYYHVGNALPGPHRPLTFVVAESALSRPTVPGGRVVAAWRLYGYSPRGEIVPMLTARKDTVRGYLVKCNNAHHEKDPYASDFLTCEKADSLSAFAKRIGIPFRTARRVLQCADSSAQGPMTMSRCEQLREENLRNIARTRRLTVPIEQAVMMLHSLRIESESNPYWFSCSLGCCTANMLSDF